MESQKAMRQIIFIFFLFLLFLASCSEETTNNTTVSDTGVVVDYAGTNDCRIVIELDNGMKIQPTYYPDGFVFAEGQTVLVDYTELKNVNNGCDEGVPCEITYIEELSCAPYIDLYFENYDSLARDPVYIHDAYVDGDCLYFKLSYSGGCQEHTVDLARMQPWIPGNETIASFEIRHTSNDDLCEAWFTREFRYDLSPLKEEGIKQFVLTAKLVNDEVYSKIFNLN